jgi:hypothetical protein
MLSLGDIALETSGETSRLEMASIERARSIARDSIAVSQGHGNAQARGKP